MSCHWRKSLAALSTLAVVALPALASARAASITVTGGALTGDRGATPSIIGMELPDDVNSPRALAWFVLPPNYAKNTPLTFVAYMTGGNGRCTFQIGVEIVTHTRPGSTFVDASRLVAPRAATPLGIASNAFFSEAFTLTPKPDGTPREDVEHGDLILFDLERVASENSDTCNQLPLTVTAIDLRYSARPSAASR
jgi:hypothetical protein